MSCAYNRTENRPKIIRAIDESIFNNAQPPIEVLEFKYRKLFGLSESELAHESTHTFYTNLYINAQIQEKQRIEAKNG